MNNNQLVTRAADNIRILAASMVERAKSGHPGGAMGGADFINVLFSEFLIFDPNEPTWSGRDRFFLDPGHMSPMLYAQLSLLGRYSMEELQQFRQWGSPTPGHPEVDVLRGVENTSGPLGQGHTFAVGAAIAAKFLAHRLGWVMSQTIYAYISDGGDPRRNITRCWSYRRTPRARQPHHVLRRQQRPALYYRRGGRQ